MSEFTVGREVSAPAEQIWKVITDVERSPEYIDAIEQVERLDDAPSFGVGTRWRETRTMFGKTSTEELCVTRVDPGHSYTVESDADGAHYESTMSVEQIGPELSRVSMSFGAEPTGFISKIFASTAGKLFEGATKKALEKDLDDIARAVQI